VTTWAIKDSNDQVLLDFLCSSRLEVARKVVPVHYDAIRLQVSSSHRELFDRVLKQVLEREGWQIVRIKCSKTGMRAKTSARAGEKEAVREWHPSSSTLSVDRKPSTGSAQQQFGLTQIKPQSPGPAHYSIAPWSCLA
jgi:hypothetical protein